VTRIDWSPTSTIDCFMMRPGPIFSKEAPARYVNAFSKRELDFDSSSTRHASASGTSSTLESRKLAIRRRSDACSLEKLPSHEKLREARRQGTPHLPVVESTDELLERASCTPEPYRPPTVAPGAPKRTSSAVKRTSSAVQVEPCALVRHARRQPPIRLGEQG